MPSSPRRARRIEWIALAIVVGCALGVRLAFVTAYPTRAFVDFRSLIRFAEAYRADGWAHGAPEWELRSLGVPLLLSFVLRVVPGSPATVARYATAVVTGLVAVAPFVIWRDVYTLRTRLLAALGLALWPGHVMVSGVVSQDNWVLLPTVVLVVLAVRVVRRPDGPHPILAAITWAVAGAIRQEMFAVLAPAALAAAGLLQPPRRWGRKRWLGFGLTALALLVALAGLRWVGSGRFSLGTEHTGLAVLGAASPGAGASYWTFGETYFAAFAPDIADDWEQMKRQAGRFALREFARRPGFHLVRMVAAGTNSLLRSDADGLFTSIGSQEAMPAPFYEKGQRLTALATWPLRLGTLALMGAALAALALAAWGRDWAILLIGTTMLLKAAIHAVTVAQYRYFSVVTALALLLIPLALQLVTERRPRARVTLAAVACGALGATVLAWVAARSEAWIVRHEEQLTYQFVLKDPERHARLRCVVRQGILTLFQSPRDAAVRLLPADPRPGDAAVAACRLEARRATDALAFEFRDPIAAGGLPGRILQVVTVNGREAVRHDLSAEPGDDWIRVPLGHVDPSAPLDLELRLTAGTAEAAWGPISNTAFRLTDKGQGPPEQGQER